MSLDPRYPSRDHSRSYYYKGQMVQHYRTSPLEVGFGATGVRKFAGSNPFWVRGLDRGARYARSAWRNRKYLKYYVPLGYPSINANEKKTKKRNALYNKSKNATRKSTKRRARSRQSVQSANRYSTSRNPYYWESSKRRFTRL